MTKDRAYCKIYNLLSNKGLFSYKAPFFNSIMRKGIFILGLALLLFSHLFSFAMGQDYDISRSKMNPELLANAASPEEFAAKYGIEIKEGRVMVVIKINAGQEALGALKKYDINVIREYKDLVKALVYVGDLKSLAQEQSVQFIRTPYKPIPLKPDKQ